MTRSHLAKAPALVLVSLWFAAQVSAHEAGFGQAVVSFPARDACVVSLTVDAASLLARLEVQAGQPRSGSLAGPEYAARIAALQREFITRVHLRFDGQEASPVVDSVRAVESAQASGTPVIPEVVLTLRARVPEAARSFTWRYDLTYASYALMLRSAESQTAPTAWLEGGQESQAFPLAGLTEKPWRTRTLAKVADYLLLLPLLFVGVLPFSDRLRWIWWQPTGPIYVPLNE